MAWSDIPTCKEAGVDTEYQMLRGIFMSPGVKPEQVAFYVDLFKKVMATDDWKKFMEEGAFNQTFMTGDEFKTWVEANRQAAPRPDEGSRLPGRRQVEHCDGAGASPARLRRRACRAGRIAASRGPADMQDDEGADDGRPLVSNRTMDIVVALLLLAVCAIVIFDSTRLGFNWREGEGPAPGYFPFYIAVDPRHLQPGQPASARCAGAGAGEIFVSVRPFGRVLAVLIPSLVFVALIGGISLGPVDRAGPRHLRGLRHLHHGVHDRDRTREPVQGAGRVGIAVPLALFLMFEKWFLVPLPKGPLEAWLGY